MPPRFGFLESANPLPCNEPDFAVGSYQEAQLYNRTFPQKCTIRFAFQTLFANPDPNTDVLEPLRNGAVNMLDLQILIHREFTFYQQQVKATNCLQTFTRTYGNRHLRIRWRNYCPCQQSRNLYA